jgi:DNA-binding transcriptional LysR family regulator
MLGWHTGLVMELRRLRYFVAAVEEGSLQRAAGRMHVAQPALSRRIRDLEDSLGCQLLERGVTGVTPTEAGRAF